MKAVQHSFETPYMLRGQPSCSHLQGNSRHLPLLCHTWVAAWQGRCLPEASQSLMHCKLRYDAASRFSNVLQLAGSLLPARKTAAEMARGGASSRQVPQAAPGQRGTAVLWKMAAVKGTGQPGECRDGKMLVWDDT